MSKPPEAPSQSKRRPLLAFWLAFQAVAITLSLLAAHFHLWHGGGWRTVVLLVVFGNAFEIGVRAVRHVVREASGSALFSTFFLAPIWASVAVLLQGQPTKQPWSTAAASLLATCVLVGAGAVLVGRVMSSRESGNHSAIEERR